jgi:potassium-transporting ATPase KdpC subunit
MIATALRLLIWFTVLTGVVYPVAVTAIGHGLFPGQAAGSLISIGGKPVGSALLAQKFTGANYFQPRPSAGDTPYATVPSAASNAGPTSEALKKSVEDRATDLRQRFSPPAGVGLPSDLLTTSGSGLDPHISPEAARFQIQSVATARGLDATRTEQLRALVESMMEPPQFGILGDPRVNVLRLNIALDAQFK